MKTRLFIFVLIAMVFSIGVPIYVSSAGWGAGSSNDTCLLTFTVRNITRTYYGPCPERPSPEPHDCFLCTEVEPGVYDCHWVPCLP